MNRKKIFPSWFYYLIPILLVAGAIILLAWLALRTTLQIEKARQQTIFDATFNLASERVDRLDKFMIAQDNAGAEDIKIENLQSIGSKWLENAARQTPTVRAILVIDSGHSDHDILSYISRAPGQEDEIFRKILLQRMIPLMNQSENTSELRHLHASIDQQSYLISYWQRNYLNRKYLIVLWHDVPRIVHEVFPQIYNELDKTNSRMNIIDEEGRIVFGPPIQVGEFTVGRPFPTTLYNWRLQIAFTKAEDLQKKVVRQHQIELAMVGTTSLIALAAILFGVVALLKDRKLAQLKSEFVANISHELKTPLSLIRMFGEMLLTGRAAEEKKKHYLEIITSESERLTDLIDNILDFAKIDQGKVKYDFLSTNLNLVFDKLKTSSLARAEREGIHLEWNIDLDLPSIECDKRAIELAISNLIDNAFKYGGSGKWIEVDARKSTLGLFISVKDHGPGILEKERNTIFDRFVRGNVAIKNRVRGSGIGLSLVKNIVLSHRGKIDIQSPIESGEGCSFTIELPLHRKN